MSKEDNTGGENGFSAEDLVKWLRGNMIAGRLTDDHFPRKDEELEKVKPWKVLLSAEPRALGYEYENEYGAKYALEQLESTDPEKFAYLQLCQSDVKRLEQESAPVGQVYERIRKELRVKDTVSGEYPDYDDLQEMISAHPDMIAARTVYKEFVDANPGIEARRDEWREFVYSSAYDFVPDDFPKDNLVFSHVGDSVAYFVFYNEQTDEYVAGVNEGRYFLDDDRNTSSLFRTPAQVFTLESDGIEHPTFSGTDEKGYYTYEVQTVKGNGRDQAEVLEELKRGLFEHLKVQARFAPLTENSPKRVKVMHEAQAIRESLQTQAPSADANEVSQFMFQMFSAYMRAYNQAGQDGYYTGFVDAFSSDFGEEADYPELFGNIFYWLSHEEKPKFEAAFEDFKSSHPILASEHADQIGEIDTFIKDGLGDRFTKTQIEKRPEDYAQAMVEAEVLNQTFNDSVDPENVDSRPTAKVFSFLPAFRRAYGEFGKEGYLKALSDIFGEHGNKAFIRTLDANRSHWNFDTFHGDDGAIAERYDVGCGSFNHLYGQMNAAEQAAFREAFGEYVCTLPELAEAHPEVSERSADELAYMCGVLRDGNGAQNSANNLHEIYSATKQEFELIAAGKVPFEWDTAMADITHDDQEKQRRWDYYTPKGPKW